MSKTRSLSKPSVSFTELWVPSRDGTFFYGRKIQGKIVSFLIAACHCSIAIMNSAFIRLWDVLETMESMDDRGKPVRFQLKFVTADRQKKTGGEIIEMKDACKCSIRTKQGKEIFPSKKAFPASDRVSKDPHHWINSTRNILLPNGEKRTIHIRLIIEFNNKKVCY